MQIERFAIDVGFFRQSAYGDFIVVGFQDETRLGLLYCLAGFQYAPVDLLRAAFLLHISLRPL